MSKKKTEEQKVPTVVIQPPRFNSATFTIEGTAPLVQHRWSTKAAEQMRATQAAGSQAKKGKKRDPKDFSGLFEESIYKSREGKRGIPSDSFRCAMISACRIVGFKMTLAKLSLFVVADGYDAKTGRPLTYFTKGKPEHFEALVRLPNGSPDIRVRGLWRAGWQMDVTIRWDADQFSLDDVSNLMLRVGQQVGLGEGRPDSPNSAGVGWGTFSIKHASTNARRAA